MLEVVEAIIGFAQVNGRLPCPAIPDSEGNEDVNDPNSLISYMDRTALKKLRDSGSLADGMLPKAAAIDAAIRFRGRHQLPSSVLPARQLRPLPSQMGRGKRRV